jgi:aspartate aminotransferase
MLEVLKPLPPDPILASLTAYRADRDASKVDLGIGVYRDDTGATPILDAVKRAESAMLARQRTKSYIGSIGNTDFNRALESLVLGDHDVLAAGRVCTIQAPGGCGALRLGAEIIKAAAPSTVVHVSTPTWANHTPLLGGSGLKLASYPYYDPASGAVDFEAMLGALRALPAGSAVLLHASCHNPTGADLSDAQWRELLPLFKRGGLLPFIDMAYQGLGRGIAEDAYGIRLFAAELPELLIAVSGSKNFGLYRERAGALHVLTTTAAAAQATLSHLARIARSIYSMPPDHGAAIVTEILADAALRDAWLDELSAMRLRMSGLREEFVRELRRACPARDFGFIAQQRGMFSLLGITAAQVQALRIDHHIYMTEDSRINIAGLNAGNIPYAARALSQVLSQGSERVNGR